MYLPSMHIPLYQVDAFTDEVFNGNPACVMLLDDWLEEDEDVDQLSYMVNEEKIVNIAESALRAGAVQQIKELKVVSAGATSTGDIRPVVRPLQSPTAIYISPLQVL